ncbi:hypothetical protein [Amycolatopsis sp. NPDC059021]|uniref:hypothetical protein n=1 Tax=Amycolatopsis sp. NPDC059021 TaxID=3346704 RepID=UPI00366BBC43
MTTDSPGEAPSAGAPGQIVQALEVSRAALRRNNPATSGHTAVVYVTKGGEYRLGAGRLTMGELVLATPKEMYLVDRTPHQETYSLQLPAQEEAFCFAASVRVTWRISDPVAAVKAGRMEPRETIGRFLEERLREVTRQFGVEQSADAERRIAHQYGDRIVPVSEAVEVTRCTAVLDLDDLTREHIAGRTKFKRDSETELSTQQLRMMRAEHARELQELKEKHELAMKQERMKVYADALRGDDVNVLALRLAGHNEDVKDVINLLMEQKRLGLSNANAVLNSLLEHKLVNRKDVADLMADASDTLLGLPQKRHDAPPQDPPPVEAKSERVELGDDEDEDDVGER